MATTAGRPSRQARVSRPRAARVTPSLVAGVLLLAMALVLLVSASPPQARPDARWQAFLPPSFDRILVGPHGGAVWQGLIPNRAAPLLHRPSLVYLPPRLDPGRRYPVLYLLHGMPGSPYSYVRGLRLATVADGLIFRRALRPLIIVMPVAGKDGRYDGEWTSGWEDFVVHDVVPWVDARLPTIPLPRARILAGMSAGGYGAADIALRHPALFGTVESWSGYFHPLHDGSLAHATSMQLDAHDPSILLERVGGTLRRDGVRFFLSSGTTGDRRLAAQARLFAASLRRFHLRVQLLLRPGGHTHRFWRAQLPSALRFAAPPQPTLGGRSAP